MKPKKIIDADGDVITVDTSFNARFVKISIEDSGGFAEVWLTPLQASRLHRAVKKAIEATDA